MNAYFEERVLSVDHWTDRLFSFKTTRNPGLRFENGQFVMLGLELEDGPLTRAYSVASAAYEDHLGFFSIKAPDGPLTSRLQALAPGDTVIVGRKATGTLVLDNLRDPGRVLYLLATGTGIAPFVATINDPATYERFERVVLAHGCREAAELAYGAREAVRAHGQSVVSERRAAQASLLAGGHPRALRDARPGDGPVPVRGDDAEAGPSAPGSRRGPRDDLRQPRHGARLP